MSPTVAMWIASILGAVLFFITGFLSAARRVSAPPQSVDDVLPPQRESDTPVAQAEQVIMRLKNERAALKQLVTQLESQLNVQTTSHNKLQRRVTELEYQLERPADPPDHDEDEDLLSDDPFDQERTRVRPSTGTGDLDELLGNKLRDADSISTLLELLEQKIAEDDTWKAAALADDLGMPVVGAGEHNEALAVFSSLLGQLQKRTRALLPIDAIRRLTVEDTQGMVVSSCVHPDKPLSLVTLTHHSTPSTSALADVLEQTARLV